MPAKNYIVELTGEERNQLKRLINTGRVAAYRQRHARILLLADQGPQGAKMIDDDIAKAANCGRATVERVRKRFVEEGLQAALGRHKSTRQYQRKLDGDCEAHLIALACSKPPEGYSHALLCVYALSMCECPYI
jgi:hypothetical protein